MMKGKELKLLVCVVVLLFGCASIALGDWDEGDPNKMHYPQLPKQGGWDVALFPGWSVWLADDWECSQTGPVSDIHFWVSWEDDMNQPINGFSVRIWSDDPCGPGYSVPNDLLWDRDFYADDITVRYMPDDLQGWFNPYGNTWDLNDHSRWAQVNITDINDPFIQEKGKIYWLMIDMWGGGYIGWKQSGSAQFRDNAVYHDGIFWNKLVDPITEESLDLAFVITTEEEPNYAKPLAPHTKWSQPPVEIDPNAEEPIFCGWDEHSWIFCPTPPTAIWPIVADDFRCLGTMPVTSIHWWGSYADYDGNEPLGEAHEEWRIRFWSNVPKDMPFPFSWPEKLLWEIVIEDDRVQINKAGEDDSPKSTYNDTCFQYYVELEPNEIFWQNDFNDQTTDDTFWMSIEALDYNTTCPHHWGWKTRPWHWMDDAVTLLVDVNVTLGTVVDPCSNSITPIKYDGNSFDVSFELDTDPNYIKWEQLYTGIRHWPHYEDEESMYDDRDSDATRAVADDWRCLRRTPVTAIVWWGSYIGYGYEACSYNDPCMLPVPPDAFVLSIWTDSPAGSDPCYPFSHPNEPIWDYEAEYDEVLVGYDKHPHGAPNEPVFRYSVRLPEDVWFHQPDYNGVFWLSVLAIYNYNVPNYNWGWTNHKHVFNDNAVVNYYDDVNEVWAWEELYDQTGNSEDMSFILFTDPNECSTCANYNCDVVVNFPDFADFADDWRWVGPAGGYNNSDLDCSGVVDFKDLGIFCMQWLTYCP